MGLEFLRAPGSSRSLVRPDATVEDSCSRVIPQLGSGCCILCRMPSIGASRRRSPTAAPVLEQETHISFSGWALAWPVHLGGLFANVGVGLGGLATQHSNDMRVSARTGTAPTQEIFITASTPEFFTNVLTHNFSSIRFPRKVSLLLCGNARVWKRCRNVASRRVAERLRSVKETFVRSVADTLRQRFQAFQ